MRLNSVLIAACPRLALAIVLSLVSIGVARADDGRATIAGTVRTPVGNAVAGAEIVSTGPASVATTSDEAGAFVCLSTPGIPVCIPYLKGYAQTSYASRDGTNLALGIDYEGKNNSYYQPPFAQLDSEFRKPVGGNLELQVSVQNLLNSNNFSNLAAPNLGVPLIAGSSTGLTSLSSALIPTPPRTVRVQLRLHGSGG